ncbi:hypothetical protein KM043_009049 [Ampulex compressa]|nr:hypothetical protein KM043_009049 [Ampulex compressa]
MHRLKSPWHRVVEGRPRVKRWSVDEEVEGKSRSDGQRTSRRREHYGVVAKERRGGWKFTKRWSKDDRAEEGSQIGGRGSSGWRRDREVPIEERVNGGKIPK